MKLQQQEKEEFQTPKSNNIALVLFMIGMCFLCLLFYALAFQAAVSPDFPQKTMEKIIDKQPALKD